MDEARSAGTDSYFASVAQSYDRLQPILAGPGYEAGLAFVLEFVPHEKEEAFVCVELGCGRRAPAAADTALLAGKRGRNPLARVAPKEAGKEEVAGTRQAVLHLRCANALSCPVHGRQSSLKEVT